MGCVGGGWGKTATGRLGAKLKKIRAAHAATLPDGAADQIAAMLQEAKAWPGAK